MTLHYCLNCKTRFEDADTCPGCGEQDSNPFFEFRWTYECGEPGCLWSGETHHDCGTHYKETGHTDYTPIRRIKDRSDETLDGLPRLDTNA